MKNYKQLLSELPSKSVVVTFGQFNPPTTGHELIIKVVRKLAKQRKSDHIVFVSSTQDKKNPLEVSKKIQYLELMFPNTRFVASTDNFVDAIKRYKNVVAVTSADNVDRFKKLLKNGKFDTTEVVSAGTKCPDSDDRVLKAATKGVLSSFKSALPTTVRELDAKRLMNDVRHGIGLDAIKEQINLVKDDLREQYFRGEIFNEGDIVESNDSVYRIVKRGSNHLLLQDETGLKVSKWIQDVQLTEREFMGTIQESVSVNPTAAPNKQLDKAKADTEKARLAAQFADEKAKLADQQNKKMENLKTSLQKESKTLMSLSDYRKTVGEDLEEARMSAAMKLQKAFQREQEKSERERKAGEELLKKPVKEETEEESADRAKELKRFKAQASDAKLTEEDFSDINEDELVGLVEVDLENLSEEDFFEAYDDEELAIIDDETGEEIEAVSEETELDSPVLLEILSRMERIKAKARMRRSQAKRTRREKIALRQLSSPQVANKRARRMAISALKKRLLRGQNPQKVSVGQKERVERYIAQRKKVVDRLSARMVTRVKQVEKARMAHKKFTKPNNGVSF